MIELACCSCRELNLITKRTLWECVEKVQEKSKVRLLKEEEVKSNKFLLLCEAALYFCEKYNLEKNGILVRQDGGSVAHSSKNSCKTSALIFDGQTLKVGRFDARLAPGGDDGVLYCRVRVPATNSAREVLKAKGWIKGRGLYAYFSLEDAKTFIPQPKSTDVVLGGNNFQPRPTDAVLGGANRKPSI